MLRIFYTIFNKFAKNISCGFKGITEHRPETVPVYAFTAEGT
jgi:hypothetical protein